MKYNLYPVISVDDLADEVNRHYDINMDGADLSSFLFGDDYQNDCYKSFYFAEMEIYEGKFWQDEERIRIKNCIKSVLQDIIPIGYDVVLVDVSW